MLAKAYGFESGIANENSEVSEAIDKMMAHDGSYLLIVNVNPRLENKPTTLESTPGLFSTSGGFGTMGYGLPAESVRLLPQTAQSLLSR